MRDLLILELIELFIFCRQIIEIRFDRQRAARGALDNFRGSKFAAMPVEIFHQPAAQRIEFPLANLFRELGVKRCSLLAYNPTWFHKAEGTGSEVNPELSQHLITPDELTACREIFSWAELVDFDH